MNPVLILIAGPNGAGKSTFYQEQLAHSSFPFINADLIAKKVFGNQDPENALVAAKLAESLRQEKVASGNSFICLLYTSPSPRDQRGSRMPSSA